MNRVICLKECPIDHLEWHSSDEEDDDDDDDDDDDEDCLLYTSPSPRD